MAAEPPSAPAPTPAKIDLVVLGVAQDAGYPQAGCNQACCRPYRDGKEPRHFAASLALLDREGNRAWLFEATPDWKDQLELLRRENGGKAPAIAGIFLTHAHYGHYAGLLQLGREVMGAKGVPVYVLPRFKSFLQKNGPWSQLVELENIELRPLEDGVPQEILPGVTVRPLVVPHRDEFSETAGFKVEGLERRVLFLPDIDKWEKWGRRIEDELAQVDLAYLDATFFADGELPGRNMAEIPHPFVAETLRRLDPLPAGQRAKVHFLHFNHTNPLLTDPGKRHELRVRGYQVAAEGEVVPLGAGPADRFKDCGPRGDEIPVNPACLLALGDLPAGFLPGLGEDGAIDLEQTRAALGEPETWEISEVYEEHFSGIACRTIKASWPGIQIKAEYAAEDSPRKAGLTELIRTTPMPLPCGLELGGPVASFQKKLGPVDPEFSREGKLGYYWAQMLCLDGIWNVWQGDIELLQKGDKVKGIRWSYWTD